MFEPIVEVDEGKLRGLVRETDDHVQYYCFKGIPYAKPPIGELRFSITEPPQTWEGIRDATTDCNFSAHFDKKTNSVVGSEDCLYLNVYTPKLNTPNLLPVVVHSHPGGYIYGQGTDDVIQGPDFLVEKDVVVVIFNYRLGVLGFLALNCKGAPGNMGMRDQVFVLKWIQRNITKFGGDPNNVTVFGCSSGGASGEYLLLSPMSRGLLHKVCAQSGSSLLHWAMNKQSKIKQLAVQIAEKQGKVITENNQLLVFLKNLPLDDLITDSYWTICNADFRGGFHFGFVPTIEEPGDWEPFLDTSTYDLLSNGEFLNVPFMMGSTSREALVMMIFAPDRLESLAKGHDFEQFLPFEMTDEQRRDMKIKLKHTYFDVKNSHDDGVDTYAIDFFSDNEFLGGSYVAASLMAKHGAPVYIYEFNYEGSFNYLKSKWNITREGASHADDTGYFLKSKYKLENPSKLDLLVRDRIVEMFTNFAKYGNPTPEINDLITAKWEPMTPANMAYLSIGEELTMKYGLHPRRTKLFEELYRKFYK